MPAYDDAPPLPGGNPIFPAASGFPATHTLQVNLEGMPLDQLLALRNQVEQRLPAKGLKDLDLTRELVLQVLALQALQAKVLEANDVPVNQIAQVANSLSAGLTTLVRLQSDVMSSERFKRVEAVVIDLINSLPSELKSAAYGRYAEAVGGIQ